METTDASYPVRVRGDLDESLSRWLWLVKWVLAVPHYVVLVFLVIAKFLLTVVAGFVILFTGKYPRGLFDFNVGVLRWQWRVRYYSTVLGTDRYPPFSLAANADYPADLEVDYPETLSRSQVVIKWWLLAIPHYLILAAFVGAGCMAGKDGGFGIPLFGILAVIAGFALLFAGRYPGGVFDFVMGIYRWFIRVGVYAGLMTDAYPPFRLDQGARG